MICIRFTDICPRKPCVEPRLHTDRQTSQTRSAHRRPVTSSPRSLALSQLRHRHRARHTLRRRRRPLTLARHRRPRPPQRSRHIRRWGPLLVAERRQSLAPDGIDLGSIYEPATLPSHRYRQLATCQHERARCRLAHVGLHSACGLSRSSLLQTENIIRLVWSARASRSGKRCARSSV